MTGKVNRHSMEVKQLEEERIVRVRAMKRTETGDTIKAFIEKQKVFENHQTKKMDDAVASRQRYLREIRDKLKEKRQPEKQVRQRKEISLDDMDPPPKEEQSFNFHRG
ncbi:hypothetical protein LOTGIDRAFT_161235 [Lottia gigantea]|uniref:Uncharacterized protein n=1 Tax=Lottia gigantea TaxID=225164 RepID=V4AH78_LOTGI|nr:hypothetical protein LOTGIDRAFT_161235 [Lottia gigantea]ESO94535.1 hypothetical protein LOTGIDRAFT_161235 [Lottia gigantea]